MYIARAAVSELPGYILSSEQKFLYYHSEVVQSYREDYQVLTCEVPNIYNWRPFVENDDLKYGGMFVDSTKLFLIVQFHDPICSNLPTPNPVLGFVEYHLSPIVDWPDLYFAKEAFCMGESFDIHNLMLSDTKISYLSAYTVPQLDYFVYPHAEAKWDKTSESSLPQNAVSINIPTGEEIYFAKDSSDVPTKIYAVYQAVGMDPVCLHHPRHELDFNKHKILVVDDPSALKLQVISEEIFKYIFNDFNVEMLCNVRDTVVLQYDILPHDLNLLEDLYIVVLAKSGGIYVLMQLPCPLSLKHLCRNAIVTATLAIPSNIDCLPLPNDLKQYCKLLIP